MDNKTQDEFVYTLPKQYVEPRIREPIVREEANSLLQELNASVQRQRNNEWNTTITPVNKRDNPLVGSFGLSPVEEGSKLNLLIEEYRRENDRCS